MLSHRSDATPRSRTAAPHMNGAVRGMASAPDPHMNVLQRPDRRVISVSNGCNAVGRGGGAPGAEHAAGISLPHTAYRNRSYIRY